MPILAFHLTVLCNKSIQANAVVARTTGGRCFIGHLVHFTRGCSFQPEAWSLHGASGHFLEAGMLKSSASNLQRFGSRISGSATGGFLESFY